MLNQNRIFFLVVSTIFDRLHDYTDFLTWLINHELNVL